MAYTSFVFNAQIATNQEGIRQSEVFEDVLNADFDAIEVRREYFLDVKKELADILKKSQEVPLTLYYSAPVGIFANRQINPELTEIIEEANYLGAKHLKLVVGDFENYRGDLQQDLAPILEKAGALAINVENDWSELNGGIRNNLLFVKAAKENNVPIGFVFDTGNFAVIGVNVDTAIELLAPFTRYVHIKGIKYENGSAKVSKLDETDQDWRLFLDKLPKDVPLGLEFPCSFDEIARQLTLV
ncbi:hypothetical protein FACS1894193_00740 [Bacilli bacterium]|nr:hypothetical protein FACS1894193_00740 [Bacilli bacterium]